MVFIMRIRLPLLYVFCSTAARQGSASCTGMLRTLSRTCPGRALSLIHILEQVKKYFGNKVYQTTIPRSIRVSEAPSYGQPINFYEPKGKGLSLIHISRMWWSFPATAEVRWPGGWWKPESRRARRLPPPASTPAAPS